MYIIIFLVLALIGGLDTLYLVKKRKKSQAPVCPLKGDCSFVLNSKYNQFGQIHTDMIGLAYFAGIILSAIAIMVAIIIGNITETFANPSQDLDLGSVLFILYAGGLAIGIYISTFLAFLMTLRMLFLQFFVIKKMCFWCLLSSACVIGMAAMLFLPVIMALTSGQA